MTIEREKLGSRAISPATASRPENQLDFIEVKKVPTAAVPWSQDRVFALGHLNGGEQDPKFCSPQIIGNLGHLNGKFDFEEVSGRRYESMVGAEIKPNREHRRRFRSPQANAGWD